MHQGGHAGNCVAQANNFLAATIKGVNHVTWFDVARLQITPIRFNQGIWQKSAGPVAGRGLGCGGWLHHGKIQQEARRLKIGERVEMIQKHGVVPSERKCHFGGVEPMWPPNWAENGAGVRPISILGCFLATKPQFFGGLLTFCRGRVRIS